MNLFILKVFYRVISVLFMSLFSLMENNFSKQTIVIEKQIYDTPVISTVVEYDTVVKYNNKLPSNKKNILVEGKNGLGYKNENGEEKELNASVSEVVEVGTGPKGVYKGNTTGYGADCKGCSGRVSCKTREGEKYNINESGEYYHDVQYGDVRIIAANLSMFKCGTIIEIDNGRLEPFLGIVMDTGSAMVNSWNSYGLVHIDIAHATEKDKIVYQATSNNASFNVQRWGW